MVLNGWGRIAQRCWDEIPEHFPDIEIDEFIVMPTRVHRIVVIREPDGANKYICSLQTPTKSKYRNMMQLSKVIATYKAAVTRKIRKQSEDYFAWQHSFHDHIIRDEEGFGKICDYIKFNASNWRDDKFFVQS